MAPVEIKLVVGAAQRWSWRFGEPGPDFTLSGALRLSSPSVRRALEWSGADIKPGEALGALELTAQLSAEPTRAKLDDLIVLIDANRGIGVLDVELREDTPPMIAGTLAFNSLDIASFLQAFTPLPQGRHGHCLDDRHALPSRDRARSAAVGAIGQFRAGGAVQPCRRGAGRTGARQFRCR
jgi:hypothetical protein